MNTAYLILGGNKGDKLMFLNSAIQLIKKTIGTIISQSDIFMTDAWGNTNQESFVNQAICIETIFSAEELLKNILAIEKQLGRIRTQQKWTERTIDIDIIFFNDEIIKTKNLIIPHPHLQNRKFVLIPMAQIANNFVHPVFKKNITTLLEECTDTLNVKKQ